MLHPESGNQWQIFLHSTDLGSARRAPNHDLGPWTFLKASDLVAILVTGSGP